MLGSFRWRDARVAFLELDGTAPVPPAACRARAPMKRHVNREEECKCGHDYDHDREREHEHMNASMSRATDAPSRCRLAPLRHCSCLPWPGPVHHFWFSSSPCLSTWLALALSSPSCRSMRRGSTLRQWQSVGSPEFIPACRSSRRCSGSFRIASAAGLF